MKKYRCEMCGKTVLQVSDHHIIPWRFSHDDSDSNITSVCSSCHKKADNNFVSLILYGEMNAAKEIHGRRDCKRYCKKYISRKILSHIKLMKRTFYLDILKYNAKTGHVGILQSWLYKPYKYDDTRIKGRACLNKAASAKGQTILAGGI